MSSTWTGYIEGTVQCCTAKRIGPTMLRSIFVTHCKKSDISEIEKESLAASMSHSRCAASEQHQSTTLSPKSTSQHTHTPCVPVHVSPLLHASMFPKRMRHVQSLNHDITISFYLTNAAKGPLRPQNPSGQGMQGTVVHQCTAGKGLDKGLHHMQG